jgi:dGTP triphosphohydrolase
VKVPCRARIGADYIAGMIDRHALDERRRANGTQKLVRAAPVVST